MMIKCQNYNWFDFDEVRSFLDEHGVCNFKLAVKNVMFIAQDVDIIAVLFC